MLKGKRIEIYKDHAGRWRYRVLSGNNQIIAASEQGYASYYWTLIKAKKAAGRGVPVQNLSEVPADPPLPTDVPPTTEEPPV